VAAREAEVVEPDERPDHRDDADQQQRGSQTRRGRRGGHEGQTLALDDSTDQVTEQATAVCLRAEQPAPESVEDARLPGKAVGCGDDDQPLVLEESAQQHLAQRQVQQRPRSWSRPLGYAVIRHHDRGLSAASLEHAPPHLVERLTRHDAQARFVACAAAGLDADLHHAEQAVEGVLDGVQVLDPRKRHVTLVAEQQARSNHQLAPHVLQAKRQVADDTGGHGRQQQEQQP